MQAGHAVMRLFLERIEFWRVMGFTIMMDHVILGIG
jgi:hypothetical protein